MTNYSIKSGFWRSGLAVALAVGVLAPGYAAKAPVPLMSVPTPVKDLYYGDALFYFYQDDYFSSLVHLDAAVERGRLPNHETEAALLRGALYLSLGQHVEAGKIFDALLNDNVDLTVRNRAWFYLGKIWYQRGYWSEAEHAFANINGKLPDGQETERHMLNAQVLLNAERYDEAIAALQKLDADSNSVSDAWLAYVRYNLGVALVRQQRPDAAIKLLDRVGQMNADTDELSSLRDKANLALGFTYLGMNQPSYAEAVLQRVRMTGPLSNKALLGLGWAQSKTGRLQEALVPWSALKERGLLDAAVQESYLAIPYAYAQLGAQAQAADYYNFAIDSFRTEASRIEESINAIRSGSLMSTVLQNDRSEQSGWYWQLRNLPDAPETRYLYDLLASNAFQEALKNYRDLKQMSRNLQTWSQSMDAFTNVIETRQLAFTQREAAMKQALDDIDMDQLETQTRELEARVSMIEQAEDIVALGTVDEQEMWRRVQRLSNALNDAAAGGTTDAEAFDKVRLMRGVLQWNMNSAYKARLWREKKEVRELAVATREARRRHILVQRAREQVPQRNLNLGQLVADYSSKVQNLIERCAAIDAEQTTYLADLAIQQLQSQQERLAQYTLQAQFALASIYDRASAGAESVPANSRDEVTP